MPMQMGFRWYGEGNDMISLSDIRQIPGVTSIGKRKKSVKYRNSWNHTDLIWM